MTIDFFKECSRLHRPGRPDDSIVAGGVTRRRSRAHRCVSPLFAASAESPRVASPEQSLVDTHTDFTPGDFDDITIAEDGAHLP